MIIKIFLLIVLFPICNSAQIISTFAGDGSCCTTIDGVQAISTKIGAPGGGMFDKYGNFYFAQGDGGQAISKVDINGIITIVAGTGVAGYNGDNIPATQATLNYPNSVYVDSVDNLYIVDGNNYRIRKVDHLTGIITTIAGTGVGGFSGDNGPATDAMIQVGWQVCMDKHGNLFYTDYDNGRLRKKILMA